MNNPFEYIPDSLCEAGYQKLLVELNRLRTSDRQSDISLCRELDSGKMLGVLIATDDTGERHTLYSFSGQLRDSGFYHPLFVEPVFDYLKPDGYFKKKEKEISELNQVVLRFESGEYNTAKREYEEARELSDCKLKTYQEECRLSKQKRNARRESGNIDSTDLAAMIRQSQFEKGELHRLKKRLECELRPYRTKFEKMQSQLDAFKEERRAVSEALQEWLFDNFMVLNARGESRNLSDIFAETSMRVPPSGAGECCGPKLLQAAYKRGLTPLSMAEYWYGASRDGEVRIVGNSYTACRGKCLPVLRWMLQGLDVVPALDSEPKNAVKFTPEIIYENEWFCVVNKPSGMLSVAGKGRALSLQEWLENKYGEEKCLKMAHRLDQDTSGLIIATFGEQSFRAMQSLFAMRKVKKKYVAELDGDYKACRIPKKGRIILPLSPDWLDRPRQFVDQANGKEALTDYEFVDVTNGRSRVVFYPHTGRTHQLRVHAASDLGLGMSIVGDRLYGKRLNNVSERLHLHAQKIEFIFPLDNRNYCFSLPIPF